ncbi:MAG: DUF4304 domain-containing protein [Proteobacteria bacterium]|nr:DUF4304 domain-containing protein [Pseudomonadota bacterium]
MSEIASRIDEVVGLGLSSLLKMHEFRKAGRTWHKVVGDNWQVVSVQASTGNSGEQGKFAVNLGVYCAQVATLAGQRKPEKSPKEPEATVRQRLGVLAHEYDHWWTVGPTSNLNEIASDVVAKMQAVGLPWLDAHLEVARVAASLEKSPSLLSFSAAWIASGKNEALRRLEEAMASRPAAKDHYHAWAVKSGLLE